MSKRDIKYKLIGKIIRYRSKLNSIYPILLEVSDLEYYIKLKSIPDTLSKKSKLIN